MGIAMGIFLIVLGLVCITPAGAALSMRVNAMPGNGGQGYKPKTITGTRLLGAVVAIVGIVVLLTSV